MTLRVVLYPREDLSDRQVRAYVAMSPIARPWVDRVEIEDNPNPKPIIQDKEHTS